MSHAEARTYDRLACVSFRKTDGAFGGLSNMAPGFPLQVNGIAIRTSEALYQACRFPHLPKIQRMIVEEKSPMTAKMKSKPYLAQSRADWDAVRVKVMRWCIRVKLAQNWEKFGALLLDTGDRPIVEDSRKDDFWGAKALEGGKLVGANVLGRLLMELREQLRGPERDSLLRVEPALVPDLLLYAEPVGVVTARTRSARPSDELFSPCRESPGEQRMLRAASLSMASQVTQAEEPVHSTSRGTSDSEHASASAYPATQYPKRLIEVDLPIKKISAHARREKSIRHGHISTLHIWWARRPLAACRAVTLAALWPDPADPLCPERFRHEAARLMKALRDRRGGTPRNWEDPLELRTALLDFIADFANWDLSNEKDYIETSRQLVLVAHECLGGVQGTRPLVVEPFAGGGAIPLEALRVGADVFASDLNPVAVLLNKVVIEYVPRYGQRLVEEVRRWGEWISRQVEKDLADFYPKDSDGATPIAYLWARTIRCEGPGCGAEIPLVRSLWLAKKGSHAALKVLVDKEGKTIDFDIVERAKDKDVEAGTVRRGSATCPVCGYTTKVARVRAQLGDRRGGAADARMFAVVTTRPGQQGRWYRLPTKQDLQAVTAAVQELERRKRVSKGVLSLVPDESTEHYHSFVNRGPIYGMKMWADYYTSRQALALVTFVDKLQEAYAQIKKDDPEFARAVATCLAMALDRQADATSSLCRWHLTRELHTGTFGRQALPMVWDFSEVCVLSQATGGFPGAVDWVCKVCETVSAASVSPGTVERASATAHPLPDDAAHAFITDPPYYYSVQYADLSDYFYVWLRRALGDAHPSLLAEPLTPKDDEIIVQSPGHQFAAEGKNKTFYESRMKLAMTEGRRVLAPSGVGVVVFAHTSTAGWEALLQAMVEAGWIVTGSWPIDTEMAARVLAQNRSVLASSVHLVCRPREDATGAVVTDSIGDWRDVLAELPRRIHEWLPRLAMEGVVGADAIFACLGPALEVYSRHSRVEKPSGEPVLLKEYLEHVWASVAKEALAMIFEGADATGFEEDARLTAMWLWTLSTGTNGNGPAATEDTSDEEDEEEEDSSARGKVAGFALEYDAARKIAQGLGAHLEELGTVVVIKGDTARLLSVAERTRALFGKDQPDGGRVRSKKKDAQLKLGFIAELEEAEEAGGLGPKGAPAQGATVLDRVHQAMILFAAARGEALRRFLVDDGVGRDTRFWTLADNLSKLYPSGTDEKRWVDGVLGRKKGLGF